VTAKKTDPEIVPVMAKVVRLVLEATAFEAIRLVFMRKAIPKVIYVNLDVKPDEE